MGSEVPKTFQLQGKIGLDQNSTIADLLNGEPTNFIDLNQAAEIPSELEKIQNGTSTGWRLLGRDPNNYAVIGNNAIDFSKSTHQGIELSTFGASGEYSFAEGYQTRAQGQYSHAEGLGTIALNRGSTSCGKFNKGISGNTIFEVGCGEGHYSRKNAIEITDTGLIKAPELSVHGINTMGLKSIVTKEYTDSLVIDKYDKTGGLINGDVTIDGELVLLQEAYFNKDVEFVKNVKLGKNGALNSEIIFSDTNILAAPSIYWDNTSKDFYIKRISESNLLIWHSGNDGPDSLLRAGYLGNLRWDEYATTDYIDNTFDLKFDKTGGIISEETTIQDNLHVQEIITAKRIDIDENSTIWGQLSVAQKITAADELSVQALTTLSDRLVVFGTSVFNSTVTCEENLIVQNDISISDNFLHIGNGVFEVRAQNVNFSNLPIVEPVGSGWLWNDAGALKISQ